MPSGSAKLIFVVAFVINCVLWSQSHYGQFQSNRKSSLARTLASFEPPSLNAFEESGQCRPLAFPIDSQCTHARLDCPAPDTFLGVHYVRHYFCAEIALRPLIFVGLLIWLIFLFSTLGISASDFFTPNLASIAQLLGLDENVAGVTFLAFGNGSPDVFSTFSAMRANSGSLAIGELLGAASFIVSCVVGSMCIIKPFRVNRGPFLRDVGFFTVAVSLLLVILSDGRIHAWEAVLMVALYLFYVFVVVFGSWWERKREKERRVDLLIRSEYQDDEHTPPGFNEPYTDDPSVSSSRTQSLDVTTSSPTRSRAISHPGPLRLQTELPRRSFSRTPSPSHMHPVPHFPQMPSFSLVGALEFRQVVASLQRQAASSSLTMFESPITPYAGGHYHTRSRTQTRASTSEADPALGLPLDERSRSRLLVTPALTEEPETMPEDASDYFNDSSRLLGAHVPSISRTPASPMESDGDTESQVHPPPNFQQRIAYILGRIIHTLFPTLHDFRSKSVLGQIASVFAAPAVMMLTLTLPIVVSPHESIHIPPEKPSGDERLIDFEEEGMERILIAEEEVQEEMHDITFNKWLMATQCILGPLFCVEFLFNGTKQEAWLLIATAITGFSAAVLVTVFADKGDHPASQMARCSMGFLVAIVWIMAIADEVVNVLQTFGMIFGLSDAIIGLTIFAMGNSLADLVANTSVAVFAPIMGFSACFGGPMLNILLGIGISGSYVIQKTGQPYELHFSSTLLVSTIGLIVLLVTTLSIVPFNDYFLSRRWGIFLISYYIFTMILNVLVEVRS